MNFRILNKNQESELWGNDVVIQVYFLNVYETLMTMLQLLKSIEVFFQQKAKFKGIFYNLTSQLYWVYRHNHTADINFSFLDLSEDMVLAFGFE